METTHSPIVIEQLCKRFQDKTVLDAVTLTIAPGEIFGLIGLNGAGKTTLIKILLDLLNADSGEVRLFGRSHKESRARENLYYLPERFQPSGLLKATEFLSLSLSYYGVALDMERARQTARDIDLDPDVLTRKVGTYSKGMTQKLGLLSVLLAERPLLILDEPMSGLDPKARVHLKKQLNAYCARGNTLFFTSHILADMDEICDRVGVIHGGKLLFVGTPGDFKKAYKESEETLEEAFLKAIA
ncbi:MAG: ABC transporter ATP-binding protein [Alphaproteobacteria bacterium]|nr:ABC transporter ATP-binding protein [Alphaproteobacteria bacterium]